MDTENGYWAKYYFRMVRAWLQNDDTWWNEMYPEQIYKLKYYNLIIKVAPIEGQPFFV